MLGHPEAALMDAVKALSDAREIGQAATLMFALANTSWTYMLRENYAAANALNDELVTLADEKGALSWKAWGMVSQGLQFALTGKASDAVRKITFGITACRSMGSTAWLLVWLSYLARAYAELGQFVDARRCIGEANDRGGNNKGKMDRSRGPSPGR
jgi:tetratricopeptide (TPR) repeat protein